MDRDTVSLCGSGEFVVMPNHVHGIITIIDLAVDNPPAKGDVGAARERPVLVPDAALDAAPHQRKVKAISELIGVFKTTSAKRIHDAGLKSFQWQRSFYERIIRSGQEAHRIRDYIQTNPLQWELDIENPQGSAPNDSRQLDSMSIGNYQVSSLLSVISRPSREISSFELLCIRRDPSLRARDDTRGGLTGLPC